MLIKYDVYGSSQATLTILHGLLGSRQNWSSVADSLQSSLRILVPTLRNHGDSPHGPHSVEAMCDDVAGLHERSSISKTNIIGHSMGGLVAMSLATVKPESIRSLIVVDVLPQAEMARLKPVFQAMESVDLESVSRRTDAVRELAPQLPDPGVRQFLLKNLERKADGTYRWKCNLAELARWVRENKRVDLEAESHYDGPTLFIGGGKSEHQIARRQDLIAEHFPNYELAIIPDAGHWVHIDAPRQFIHVVSKFLTEHHLE